MRFRLGALLEQILTPDQFDRNVQTKDNSREAVEFAVCLPGQGADKDSKVWLPIDAKFPQEDYLRLVEARENGDAAAVDVAVAALIRSIEKSAKDISTKYLNPPKTTDFAILFLPTEGLYAETLRQPGLIERLQDDHRIVVAGPTTLAALLNSLRMGFRTLAIEQRSSEVWKVLAGVKSELMWSTKSGHRVKVVKCHNEVNDDNRKKKAKQLHGRFQARCSGAGYGAGLQDFRSGPGVWTLEPI